MSVTSAPRSRGIERLVLPAFRVLGVLFLSVWAAFAVAILPSARAYSLDERLLDRLPQWVIG